MGGSWSGVARALVLPLLAGAVAGSLRPPPAQAQEMPGLAGARQAGTLTGEVRDAASGSPVRAASIALTDLGRSTMTDGEGRFVLRALPSGTHALEIHQLGFRPFQGTVRIAPDSVTSLAVSLEPSALELPDIDVEVEGGSFLPGFLHRREQRDGHFFTRREIAERDPFRLSDFVASLPHVNVRYTPLEGFRVGLLNHRRGSRAEPRYCTPTLFRDGQRLPEGWELNDIDPRRVMAMEIYWNPSEVPRAVHLGTSVDIRPLQGDEDPVMERDRLANGMDLGATAPFTSTCGAILIWTRFRPTPR